MVAQGVLPFQYRQASSTESVTALAGLPVFFELMHVAGLRRWVPQLLGERSGGQGWMHAQMVSQLTLLHLAGGECVDDLERLEADQGLGRVLRELETYGMTRRERRAFEKRWRKGRGRSFASPTACRDWLRGFHNDAEEERRPSKEAFIPAHTPELEGLMGLPAKVAAFLQAQQPSSHATLDLDATVVESHKREALYCYKGYPAYQPLNVYWAEHDLVVRSEFRDGNVPAGHDKKRVFVEALDELPDSVETVRIRTDTAGYQWDLLRYCEEGRHPRFGRIEFAVGVAITDAFKRAIATTPRLRWHRVGESKQRYAEVDFVPEALGATRKGDYRFLAIVEPVEQLDLFDDEPSQLSFHTLRADDEHGRPTLWKLTGLVTNRHDLSGTEVIQWLRQRCGKSEEVHAVMKHDLGGGRLPAGDFGANAAWWQIMIVAANLAMAMKRLALGESWVPKRMKALRFWFISVPARLIRHARELVLEVTGESEAARMLLDARHAIRALPAVPAG